MTMTLFFLSCRKDGMRSPFAQKIQYRWERISTSTVTDYLDGRSVSSSTTAAEPGSYMEFRDDGYFFNYQLKYQYKVEGDRIMYVLAGSDRFTTPQYKDTLGIQEVNEHLLVLNRQYYFVAGSYRYLKKTVDSLKK